MVKDKDALLKVIEKYNKTAEEKAVAEYLSSVDISYERDAHRKQIEFLEVQQELYDLLGI